MHHELSRVAAEDITEIYLYGYFHFGETQADRYAALLENAIALICANPETGRLDARVNPAIRRFECEQHVIFYDQMKDHILIVRILHGAMDFMRHVRR